MRYKRLVINILHHEERHGGPAWTGGACSAVAAEVALASNGPKQRRESASNVFYCTFTKRREYKSQSTDFFFLFLLEGVYANVYPTTAATGPSEEESREEPEGLQSHF